MRRIAVALLLAAAPAWADDPPADPPADSPAGSAADRPTVEDLQDQLIAQQRANELLAHKVEALSTVEKSRDWLASFLKVYIDVGAFAVGGNGSGIRSDVGHIHYPQYAGVVPAEWVFMGDPRSTAINSLGEPADTSNSRAERYDALRSGGHPTLLVNSIGLAVGKELVNGVSVSALVEMLPRPHQDLLDVEYAKVNYRPLPMDLVIEAGKIDSVLGVEYRSQDAPRRLTVTPSLIARYTSGRTYGVDARMSLGRLVVSAALTDGNMMDHRFERETRLHSTWLPNIAGHVQWKQPLASGGLEVGVSAAAGPQDDQDSTSVAQWHVGADVQLLDIDDWDVVAEYVQGLQQGQSLYSPCDVAQCLSYKGAYVLVDHRVTSWFTPYGRIDWRDAVNKNGAFFVYESHVARATIGAHFEMTNRILAKIEYTFNRELDGIPQFADDVLTTSLVVATD